MSGKKYIFVYLCFFLIMAQSACTKNEKVKTGQNDFINFSQTSQIDSDKLLEKSVDLPYYDDSKFTPTNFNDEGLLLGELETSNKEKFLASLNVETKEYSLLKNTNSLHLGIITSSKSYVFFFEVDSINKILSYYLYRFDNKEIKKIYETKQLRGSGESYGIIINDTIFYSLYNEAEEKAIANLMKYDIKSDNTETIMEGINVSIREMNNRLYYIHVDNENTKTSLYEYDISGQINRSLYEKQGSEEWIYYLGSNEKDLYLFMNNGEGVNCYKYDFDKNNCIPYLKNDTFMDHPEVFGNYMHWWGQARSNERIKPQKYLYNINKKTNYLYDDGLILMSKKGIVWVDFKKKDKDIPKGEIFNDENSVLKYLQF